MASAFAYGYGGTRPPSRLSSPTKAAVFAKGSVFAKATTDKTAAGDSGQQSVVRCQKTAVIAVNWGFTSRNWRGHPLPESRRGWCLPVSIPPQHGPPPHVHHREDEVFYVLEGEFTFTVAGRTIHAKAGQTLYGKWDVPHTFKNTGNKSGRMLVVVTPPGLEKFFAEVGTPLASPQAAPVEPPPADFQRLLAAAPRCGLEIIAPANP